MICTIHLSHFSLPVSFSIMLFYLHPYVPVTPWWKGKVSLLGQAVVQLATPDAILVVHLARRLLLEAVLRNANALQQYLTLASGHH
jgi:hypothetical protein